jgi:hypothetical protein
LVELLMDDAQRHLASAEQLAEDDQGLLDQVRRVMRVARQRVRKTQQARTLGVGELAEVPVDAGHTSSLTSNEETWSNVEATTK